MGRLFLFVRAWREIQAGTLEPGSIADRLLEAVEAGTITLDEALTLEARALGEFSPDVMLPGLEWRGEEAGAGPLMQKKGAAPADFRAEEARDTEGRLLAPNGKPSNLNERQWHQARSVPFLRWFGNWRYDPNRAVKVVEVDASDMRKDVPDHKNVKAVFSWLVDNIFASSPVTVKSTGAKVGFSKRALNASLKRRGKEQRRAYAGLKRLIADAEYFGFEQADKKHARSLDGQDIYYSAMRLDGQDYSVKIKIDIAKTDKTSTYKDHKVSSIEIAPVVSPSLARESGEPTARPGATSSYKISTLAGNVKPETSKVLDKNGEPPSSTITEFERENPNVLRKDSTDAPRGMHTVEDGRSVLTFFQAKDLSTAPHEIYHVFRWMFADLAQDERAPQWLGDDWAKALCNTKCNTQDGN